MKKLTMRINDALHKQAKEFAAVRGVTLAEYVSGAITQRLVSDAKILFGHAAVNTAAVNTAEETEEKGKEKETKEKKQKKVELKEKGKEEKEKQMPMPNARASGSEICEEATCQRHVVRADEVVDGNVEFEHPGDDEVRAYAKNVKPIPGEIVEVWLARAKENGWYAKDRRGNIIRIDRRSWRVLLNGFARNYMREGGSAVATSAPLPRSRQARPSQENKKPSWMTWQQWEFEESERMRNEERNRRVEEMNKHLDEITKEFGI